jgi:predicted translin family RNA/ssDNA-binding protein
MAKKSTRNSDILYNSKEKTSPKIYSILVKLVNDDREDLAEIVLKIDYLLQYASTCINQKDFEEAREGLEGAKSRIDMLKKENVDIEHIEYLYEGIYNKCKK